MMGQQLELLGHALGVETLQRVEDALVQGPAPIAQEALVGHL